MTIIDDYLEKQEKYRKLYGDNTIVLMQVGHFYEVYAIDNEIENINSENLYRLADILNIIQTKKNKNFPGITRGNPLMIGINILAIDKYIQMLMNANYTTIIIDQVSEPPNCKREVTNIYSPGTNIDHISHSRTNNLMTIYIELNYNVKSHKEILSVGISIIDVSTGKNMVYESYSVRDDILNPLDECFRLIQTHDPQEILFITKYPDGYQNSYHNSYQNSILKTDYLSQDYLSNYLNLSQLIVHFRNFDEIDNNYTNIHYQNEFLKKIFKCNDTMLSMIEYLDLERHNFALISYILLLDFAYQHNETIVSKIEKPEIFDESKYLILTNNSINQLNVVSENSINKYTHFNSLFSVLDKTNTPIGRRFLRDYLLNPIISPNEIEKRYDLVQFMYDNNRYTLFEEFLRKIVDIERIHRKLILGRLQPFDFGSMDNSYENILNMLNLEIHENIKPSKEAVEQFQNFIAEYRSIFNLDIISKYNFDTINESFLNKGVNSDVDKIQEEIDNARSKIKAIQSKFSVLLDDNINTLFKFDYTEKDGYFIHATEIRCKKLKIVFSNMHNIPINITNIPLIDYNVTVMDGLILTTNDITFKKMSANKMRISGIIIDLLCSSIRNNIIKVSHMCKHFYKEKIEEFANKYSIYLKEISKFIGEIDLYKSIAKVSHLYGYYRPTIVKHPQNVSFINAKDIRHPIIERIQTKTEYITNDIFIGNGEVENTDKVNGILLYGTNASGKSSLMKAVGLNIIMAQAGFFVPSRDFRYSPYQYLFTRILNNDNIFKGASSFAVEMSELKSIIKRSNNRSIILGDELCSGTENISAQSIFASCVITLDKRNSNFIFATHLHQLYDMDCIKNITTVKPYHLKVEYNDATGELIYNRKLTPGNGESIYGLEVCKAMGLDSEFIELADKIRREILNINNRILEPKQSKYNAKVIVDLCEICGNTAEDTHHIKFQCNANADNIIGKSIQKDIGSNLVPLCKPCHVKTHNGELNINGYIQTSIGVKLDYNVLSEEEVQIKIKSRKKYTPTQIAVIKELKEIQGITQVRAIGILEKTHNIKISNSTLSKVWANKY